MGPFVRDGLPDEPMFLFVVKGMHRKVGKKKPHWKHRKPSFYLVSAVQINREWQLPLPTETILAWLWQRWELEVAQREMKSDFGVGEKQCWNPRSSISSVEWRVWVYALLLLSAYRSWGLLQAPAIPTRWWQGATCWSFNTLWRQYRSALWGPINFRPFGHEPRATSSKKKLTSSITPIPFPPPLIFNAKRALTYPFRFFCHFPTFLI